jgi:hypothetical protein
MALRAGEARSRSGSIRLGAIPTNANTLSSGLEAMRLTAPDTTPTGINPGWTCYCRQLYLTQELDLLCMGIVVVLTKSFISFVTKNKYLAVNPPSTSAENFGVSQK